MTRDLCPVAFGNIRQSRVRNKVLVQRLHMDNCKPQRVLGSWQWRDSNWTIGILCRCRYPNWATPNLRGLLGVVCLTETNVPPELLWTWNKKWELTKTVWLRQLVFSSGIRIQPANCRPQRVLGGWQWRDSNWAIGILCRLGDTESVRASGLSMSYRDPCPTWVALNMQ